MNTKTITLSGFFMALGMVLPFLTGQIPYIGSMLLPMHIPVILCGLFCGWPSGLLVGLLLPVMRSLLLGMPPLFPVAVTMSLELGAYGFLAGYLNSHCEKRTSSIYVTLVGSMAGGRVIWGLAASVLYPLAGVPFSWKVFTAGAFLNAIPGILLQILLIPVVVLGIQNFRSAEKESHELL